MTFGVPVAGDLGEDSSLDLCLEKADYRVAPHEVTGLKEHAGLFNRIRHAIRIYSAQTQWFFDEIEIRNTLGFESLCPFLRTSRIMVPHIFHRNIGPFIYTVDETGSMDMCSSHQS